MDGKLKIFLGYAAGSGKTYTMLEAAHEAKRHGIDVVAGYIEPHDRPDTIALIKGLEEIPKKQMEYRGVTFQEFDIDAALERKPKLILVDELAHTNVNGCRNEKRYQDVNELLRAGIDVYTTVNIQHLESLNDLVGTITQIEVRERVPDWVFDSADQVEVIDIEPEDLIDRMKEGKIYKKQQAERALDHFFRREKLAALREITLRRIADRVNHKAEEERNLLGNRTYHTGEHVLVCISAAESNRKVIRSAARLAYAFHAQFTALYVETPKLQEASEKTKQKIRDHKELARTLGAKIVSVFGTDIGGQIAEYAMIGNVSKVVMGRTNHRFRWGSTKSEILERINRLAPQIDVYVIPDIKPKQEKRLKQQIDWTKKGKGCFGIVAVLSVFMAVAIVLQVWDFPEANIIMLFAVGLVTAIQTQKLRKQNAENVKKAYRTEILLENSQKLRRCKSKEEVWNQVAYQAGKLLDLSLLIYPVDKNKLLKEPLLFPKKDASKEQLEELLTNQERGVAKWVVANHHRAGACTHTLPTAKALYLPIQDAEEVKGVMGIYLEERRMIHEFKYGLLVAMLNETGVKLQDTF